MVMAGSVAVLCALVTAPAIAQQVAGAPPPAAVEDGTTTATAPPEIAAPPRPSTVRAPPPQGRVHRPIECFRRPRARRRPFVEAAHTGTWRLEDQRAPAAAFDEYVGGGAAQGLATRQAPPTPRRPVRLPTVARSGSGAPDDRGETGATRSEPRGLYADGSSGAQTELAGNQAGETPRQHIERIVGVVPLPLKLPWAFWCPTLARDRRGAAHAAAPGRRAPGARPFDAGPQPPHADELWSGCFLGRRKVVRWRWCPSTGSLKAIKTALATRRDTPSATADGTLNCCCRITWPASRRGFHRAASETGSRRRTSPSSRTRGSPTRSGGPRRPTTASFGIAAYPDHGVGADELIKAADVALYRAKETGRDRVETSAQRLRRVA